MILGWKPFLRWILLIISMLIISACTTKTIHPTHGTVGDQIQADMQQAIASNKTVIKRPVHVPSSVNNALLPSVTSNLSTTPVPEPLKRFDVAADKVQAKVFFMSLVNGTSYNIVVNPDVTGLISLDLKNVTIPETLEAVRDVYGYQFHRTSYGYEILPQELETRIYTINYLDVKRKGKSLTQVKSGQISDNVGSFTTGSAGSTTMPTTPAPTGFTSPDSAPSGSSIDTSSESNFWHDIETSLKQIIGNQTGHSVVVNAQAGVVIVHAFPPELQQVGRFLERIQTSLTRQVIIDAKILEIDLNDQFQAGIDWNLIGKVAFNDGGIGQTSNATAFPNTNIQPLDTLVIADGVSTGTNNAIFTLNINGDFGALINLLQTQGNVQVLSSPRISTINNQKAIIKVGQDEFFVTGVTSNNIVTGSATVPSQSISLTPFFSGVTLDVTPQISSEGNIILHIHPSVSLVVDQTKNIVLGNGGTGTAASNTYTLPLALSTIRESDNVVRAKNGQTVVIGGLMQNTMTESIAAVPVVSKLPGVGPFFRRTQQISKKSELVLLLRPIIVEKHSTHKYLVAEDRTVQNMNRGFHSGSLPEIFGNEAEKYPTRQRVMKE